MEENNNKCSVTNSAYESGSFSDLVHQVIYSPYSTDNLESQAELQNKIVNLFSPTEQKPKQQKIYELHQWRDGLVWEFEIHFENWLKEHSWNDPEFGFWISKWNSIAVAVATEGENSQIAELLYLSLYRLLRKYEEKYGTVSKGLPLHQLGWSKLIQNLPKSKTYFLLALIEDIINAWRKNDTTKNFQQLPAYRILHLNFSEPKEYLDKFEQVVEEFINSNKYEKQDIFYPEEVLVWYVTRKKFRVRVSDCFIFDPIHATYLFNKVNTARSKVKRGRALEQFIAYILLSQTKFEVLCNLRELASETDLRLRNFNSDDPFINELGRYILVESKNTVIPTAVKDVNDFITNVIATGCNSGILFSMNGVTGTKKNKDANYAIRQIYHKRDIIILLLDKNDLEDIIKGVDFHDLLLEKYEKLRFDV